MNTVSILTICAFLYLAFVTWMFRGKGNKTDNGKDAQKTVPERNCAETGKNTVTVVPQSDFDMEKFRQVLTESMTAAITYVLKANIGDVNTQDVEFRKTDKGAGDNDTADTGGDTPDETPDMGDFEPDSVSPPATGESLDEIEAAVSVAANPAATQEQKAGAGKVLSGMRDVVFIGRLMEADDKINAGIMNCIAESVRAARKKRVVRSSPSRRKGRGIDVDDTLRRPENTDTDSKKDEED